MKRHSLLSVAVFLIPIHSPDGWNFPKFSMKVPTQYTFSTEGMKIEVNRSASPALYRFDPPRSIERLEVEGSVGAFPTLDSKKSEIDQDDYALRIGIVFEGDRRLNFFQRLIAPAWLRSLAELNADHGFGSIRFYVLSQQQIVGSTRPITKTSGVSETVVASSSAPGPLHLEILNDEKAPVIGLWIQADGDGTKSAFTTTVTKIAAYPKN